MAIVASIGSSSHAEVGGNSVASPVTTTMRLRSGENHPEMRRAACVCVLPPGGGGVDGHRHHDAGTFNARYGGVDMTISASE